jgi:phospholipid/cholesterol/gamma-HCH transport system substrate-binding protein
MNPLKSTQLKVGFFVVVVLAMIALLSMQASEDPGFVGSSHKLYFRLDDASGLIVRSAVKVAGIDVGIIKSMKFDKGKALIGVSIRSDIRVTSSASVEIRPNGILGDKYVEILPGDPDDVPLGDNAEILLVNNKASMDQILKEIGKVTASVSEVADALKAAVKDGGEKSGPLGRIISNIDKLTADLAEVSRGNKQKFNEIVDNVHEITATLDETVNDDGPDGFRQTWKRISRAVAKLDRSMSNVEEITAKVNNGEGTLGKLVNDEATVEKLNTAIDGVNAFMGSANKLQTAFDYHSEYLMEQSLVKSYLSLQIQPGLDRYYEIGIVDDPKGVVETTDTTDVTNPGVGQTQTRVVETKIFKNQLKYTAIFAKNFFDLTVRAGLIESSGGVGFDYHLFRNALRLTTDFFDLGSDTGVHARAYAKYFFYKGIYLTAGGDDLFGREAYSTFAGLGINLTNDDLSLLLKGASLH